MKDIDIPISSRQNRVHMIQTVEQYVYLYQALIEGLLTMDTNMPLQEYLLKERLPMDPKSQYKVRERKINLNGNVLFNSF